MTAAYQPTTPPPYLNRWRTKPEPEVRRCAATTTTGQQCRATVERGMLTCHIHADQRVAIAADALKLEEIKADLLVAMFAAEFNQPKAAAKRLAMLKDKLDALDKKLTAIAQRGWLPL